MPQFMTFNSACSFTCLAVLLENIGINTTDEEIIRKLKLPFLFHYSDHRYLCGTMLQGKELFDAYLNQFSYIFNEVKILKQNVPSMLIDNLSNNALSMLGIIENESKHSMVAISYNHDNEIFNFIDPSTDKSSEYHVKAFTYDELLNNLDSTVYIGWISPNITAKQQTLDRSNYSPLDSLDKYIEEVTDWMNQSHDFKSKKAAKEHLFKPILSEARIMMDVAGYADIAIRITDLTLKFRNWYHSKLNTLDNSFISEYLLLLNDYRSIVDSNYI